MSKQAEPNSGHKQSFLYSRAVRAINYYKQYGARSFFKKALSKLRASFFPTPTVPIVYTDMLVYEMQTDFPLDQPLTASFHFPLNGLSRIEVLTATYLKAPGALKLVLREKKDKRVIRSVVVSGEQIKDGDYTVFCFRPVRKSAEKEYEFILKGIRPPYPAVWLNPDISFPEIELDPICRGSINCRIYSSVAIDEIYQLWIKKHEPNVAALEEQRKTRLSLEPTISLIVPVFQTPRQFLVDMIESVIDQTYGQWELCLAVGGSTEQHVREVLEAYAAKEPRIKVKFLGENKGIAGNSNEALSLASGDYIGLLDHDDLLSPFALFDVVKTINDHPEAEFIYSDQDNISEDGAKRTNPFFKPEFSPYYLLSSNYISHLCVFKKNVIGKIGGFRLGFDGSQDYDLILRATEETNEIVHIPKILYHWRISTTSAAGSHRAKPYAYEAAKKVISEALKRRGMVGGVAMIPNIYGLYRIILRPREERKVSIIIPSKDSYSLISRCIESILARTTYQNYEIVVVDNASSEPGVLDYYQRLSSAHQMIKIVCYDEPFNFQRAINLGVRASEGDFLILLNNDTAIITEDWIEQMLAWCSQDDVGAVGCKLLYEDNTIQHAGLLVGVKGYVSISHHNLPKDEAGYGGAIQAVKEYSAAAAACLMTKRTCFEMVGGFDEQFQIAHGDIDFCLKLRRKGFYILYIPTVEIYHYESKTRGYEDTPEKIARFRQENSLLMSRWKDILVNGDPYYSPNLNRETGDFTIRV